jgi:DNA-binding SARP family transcriptional activator
MFSHLRALAVQQLRTLQDHIRLVIVHPNYAQQHVVMEEFLDKPAVYVRFEGAKLSQAQVRNQVEFALEAQAGSKQLDAALTLILDECDRATSSALNSFLPEIVMRTDSTRFIVFSRTIPQCVLDEPDLRKRASFIPNDANLMLWDYAQHNSETHLLEVRAFGEGRVLLNGKGVDSWDGVLPRSLFFYLVDRGMTTRSEIFETFWPNLTTREATNVFHVTKRKISEVLGTDLTKYWSGFYRISPDIHLSYDAVIFSELIQSSAVASAEDAVDQLTRAIALYQGHFLYASDMEWVRRRREELSQNYGEALATLARLTEELGHKDEALGLYLRAAANNRHREDLIASIMQLYRQLGMPADALAVYDMLEVELREELSVTPAPYLQELASAIRREIDHIA